jgi:dCMP deaminase
MESNRPTWDEYFKNIAILASSRSNCMRKNVGCIIVKDNRILSTGYNGTPKGIKNCLDGGCERCGNKDKFKSGEGLELCVCLHAEENALLFASYQEVKGATLYCTHFPCLSCAKKIIQCEIKNVIYMNEYCFQIEDLTKKLFDDVGIVVKKI